MDILLINDYLEGGGAESVFRDQFEILKKDFNVELFYGFKQISDKKISPFSYIYSFHFKKKLAAFLANRSFDFIIVHNYNSALSPSILDVLVKYKKRHKCKIIYYAHDYHLICPNRGYCYFSKGQMINFQEPPTFWNFLTKRLDSKGLVYSLLKKGQWISAYTMGKKQEVFDLILAPSDFLTNQIKQTYPHIEATRVYNSCYALNSNPKETRNKKNSTLKLVYFGRLDPVKGLVNFIEALRNSTIDYSFTIIGEGEELAAIQDVIGRYNLQDKIFLKAKLNQADLFIELQNYDVFVLPSLWYENAPLSIVEAASVGLGLFLSNHGGVLEMGKICNASHFFNPFDPEDIRLKLNELYKEFLAGSLPESDKQQLQLLFSKETYIENLKNCLVNEK
jgi:glycosyltransferase involved in cell wall biosynthesis